MADLRDPEPSGTFITLDQRDDSIDGGYYLWQMLGFDPRNPAAWIMDEHPSSYHNGAGSLNFRDGHSETHRWRDPRTSPKRRADWHLALGVPSPGNVDSLWIMERATSRK